MVTEISTAEEFDDIRNDLSGEYKLVNDIDLSSFENFEPIGDDDNGFTGTLDGQGYEITGLTIDRPDESNIGLIGDNEGIIMNIGVVNADINCDSRVGGLVGENSGGEVSESYATGEVTGEGDRVGGLVGRNTGEVSESYATCTVTGDNLVGGLVGENTNIVSESYATGSVTGEGDRVGGLVGWNNDFGEVIESYATGSVSGNNDVGGLVGENSGGVIESYSTGSVTGEEDNVGGLVGNNDGIVSESYWDTESSEIDESDGGTGLTTDEMIGEDAETNMEGFDFENTWSVILESDNDADDDGYPILKNLEREVQLEIQDILITINVTITTLTAEDITDTSAKLTAEVTDVEGVDGLNLYIQYRDSETNTVTEQPIISVSIDDITLPYQFSTTVTGLDEAKEYEFRGSADTFES